MSYVPRIDPNECSAHGDCVDIAPQVFQLDDTAVVIGTGPQDLVLEAAGVRGRRVERVPLA